MPGLHKPFATPSGYNLEAQVEAYPVITVNLPNVFFSTEAMKKADEDIRHLDSVTTLATRELETAPEGFIVVKQIITPESLIQGWFRNEREIALKINSSTRDKVVDAVQANFGAPGTKFSRRIVPLPAGYRLPLLTGLTEEEAEKHTARLGNLIGYHFADENQLFFNIAKIAPTWRN